MQNYKFISLKESKEFSQKNLKLKFLKNKIKRGEYKKTINYYIYNRYNNKLVGLFQFEKTYKLRKKSFANYFNINLNLKNKNQEWVYFNKALKSLAHSWRQPLNNLNLCIENLFEEMKEEPKEIDEIRSEYKPLMMQILKSLSQKIDDFAILFDATPNELVLSRLIQASKTILDQKFIFESLNVKILNEKDVIINGETDKFLRAICLCLENLLEIKINNKEDLIFVEVLENEEFLKIDFFKNCNLKKEDKIIFDCIKKIMKWKDDKVQVRCFLEKNIFGMEIYKKMRIDY